MIASENAELPKHVPNELVSSFSLKMGTFTEENPWETIIPAECNGPDITYAPDGYPAGGPAWILRRTSDIKAVYQNPEYFSSANFSPFGIMAGEDWGLVPAELDPPDHGPMRQFLNPLFSPQAMKKMEQPVKDAALRCIERFKSGGEIDFVTAFSAPYPVGVILDLMELPQDKMEEFLKWEKMMLHSGDFMEMVQGTRNSVAYLKEVLAERQAKPGDDLISYMIKNDINGNKATYNELMGYFFNLFIGGLDTVTASLSNMFRYLAEHPVEQQFLRENPDRIPAAVDELMRAFSPVTTYRTVTKEIEISGVKMMPDDKVAMSTTLANRDSKEYDKPHDVQLDRKSQHVAFANGIHFCLGVHLAKRELRIAVAEMLAAFSDIRLQPGVAIKSQVGGVVQPTNLPLILTV
jgi:cytochrome P450